jgi:hypothetical protein
MAPVSATGALETERSRMKAFGAGGGATYVPTFRKIGEEEPRPPPTDQKALRALKAV